MDYKIIDNVLPKEGLITLNNIKSSFPWYLTTEVTKRRGFNTRFLLLCAYVLGWLR